MKKIELQKLKEKIQSELVGKTYAGIITLKSFDGETLFFHGEILGNDDENNVTLSYILDDLGIRNSFFPEFIFETLRSKIKIPKGKKPLYRSLVTKEEVYLRFVEDTPKETFCVKYVKKGDSSGTLIMMDVLDFFIQFDFIKYEIEGA